MADLDSYDDSSDEESLADKQIQKILSRKFVKQQPAPVLPGREEKKEKSEIFISTKPDVHRLSSGEHVTRKQQRPLSPSLRRRAQSLGPFISYKAWVDLYHQGQQSVELYKLWYKTIIPI